MVIATLLNQPGNLILSFAIIFGRGRPKLRQSNHPPLISPEGLRHILLECLVTQPCRSLWRAAKRGSQRLRVGSCRCVIARLMPVQYKNFRCYNTPHRLKYSIITHYLLHLICCPDSIVLRKFNPRKFICKLAIYGTSTAVPLGWGMQDNK